MYHMYDIVDVTCWINKGSYILALYLCMLALYSCMLTLFFYSIASAASLWPPMIYRRDHLI